MRWRRVYSIHLRQRAVLLLEEVRQRRSVVASTWLRSTAVRWLDLWNRTGSGEAHPGVLGKVAHRVERGTSAGRPPRRTIRI